MLKTQKDEMGLKLQQERSAKDKAAAELAETQKQVGWAALAVSQNECRPLSVGGRGRPRTRPRLRLQRHRSRYIPDDYRVLEH